MILDCVFMQELPPTLHQYLILEKSSIDCQSTRSRSSPSPFQCPTSCQSTLMSPPMHKTPQTTSNSLCSARSPKAPAPLPAPAAQSGRLMDVLRLGTGKGGCFGFCPDKKGGRANHPSTFPFYSTASHLVSSASGRPLRSSPHEAALVSSCTSAPGSLTSLFLVSDCQDTTGREKRWLEADLSRCKPALFFSPPPPGEVRPFPTAQGGGKRKQVGKLTRPLQNVLCCA